MFCELVEKMSILRHILSMGAAIHSPRLAVEYGITLKDDYDTQTGFITNCL